MSPYILNLISFAVDWEFCYSFQTLLLPYPLFSHIPANFKVWLVLTALYHWEYHGKETQNTTEVVRCSIFNN